MVSCGCRHQFTLTQYPLDTYTCIYLIKRQPPAPPAKLQSLDIASVGIPSITLSELEYGAAKSSRPQQNRLALAQFLAPLDAHPFWRGRSVPVRGHPSNA